MKSITPDIMLELKGITKIFNRGTQDEKKALDQIDLTVLSGDFITLIGSNGAGKSTLLDVVAGSHEVDEGSMTIYGRDVIKTQEHERARHLSRVFQNPTMGTAGEMTIEENLNLAELRGQRRGLGWGVTKSRRQKYRNVLKTLDLGLEDRLKDKVGLLSGGQRQSLALLMATLSPPELLLLDEHTAALDPQTAAKVMELSDQVIEKHKLTALMVTHNMNQALTYGNRIVMLHEGRVQLDVRDEEKSRLTVAEVINTFGRSLNDVALFSTGEI